MNIIEVNLKTDLKNIVMSLYSFSYTFEAVHSEKCRVEGVGDYTSAIALGLGKKLGRNPREIGDEIEKKLKETENYSKVIVSGPGFINVTGVSHNFNEIKSFADVDLPMLVGKIFNGMTVQPIVGNRRRIEIAEQAESALRRIRSIRHVLNEEGIGGSRSIEISNPKDKIHIDAKVLERLYLSEQYRNIKANINTLFDYDQVRISEEVYLNTLQELLDAFEKIEKLVVYRKYNRDELTIIEKIYYEFQQIFDKII